MNWMPLWVQRLFNQAHAPDVPPPEERERRDEAFQELLFRLDLRGSVKSNREPEEPQT
jgi:hypothetical protein